MSMAISTKMAKFFLICIFFLAITLFGCVNSARILDEVSPVTPLLATAPEAADPSETIELEVAPTATLPGGQITDTLTTPAAPALAPADDQPDTVLAPMADVAPVATTPIPTPGASTSTAAVAIPSTDQHAISFFMHDILGGSHPSGRLVTGIVANTDANNLPFSETNNQVFPINGGVPLNTINDIINNNNYPFLVGLNGQQQANTVVQNSGNNNVVNGGNNQPFVTVGQLPASLSLQQLMFGSITVVDNEITEGHELGSAALGKAQGFYMASSLDGTSHTLALTALFHSEHDHELQDTISFFGVHRTAMPISHLAIIGGTGKYENAKGYATLETLPHVDQHTTDGVETISHVTVCLTP